MSKALKLITSTLLLFIGSSLTYALNQKAYVKISDALQRGDIESAETLLEKQIKKEKRESTWYRMLDDTYQYTDNTNARITLLEKALATKKITDVDVLRYRLALALSDAGRYAESMEILQTLKQIKAVRNAEQRCLEAEELKAHPVDFEITPMGDSINTPYDNIWPFIDNDKSRFYTTVVMGKSTVLPRSFDIQEDIFCSQFKDSVWMPTSILQGELRSNDNEGACCITADGKYLFFAACNRGGTGGGCDIYYSMFKDGLWSRPLRAPYPLNQLSWQSTPSISADGSTLYFSGTDKNRKSGTGQDIYMCNVSYMKDGSLAFSNVTRLSDNINSTGNEISPFISPYNNILYFASDGRGGMGGLDIYYSVREEDGSWGKAKNLGYPVNTHRDEFGFAVDINGEYGYMSCNGIEGGEFWQNKRIVKIALGSEHRANAPFEGKGTEFTLENIYFDSDASTLKGESFPYLDSFAEYLTVHPLYSISIEGHTDNTGNELRNLELSAKRAESVAAYLIGKGITNTRIQTFGYGSSKPKGSNETEEGKAVNRRIEVVVIKK